jgi:hypothetical protein
MSAPRGSGVGRVKATVVGSGKPVPNAVPRDEEPTIKGMETAAIEGTTAGAESLPQNPATAPGSNKSIPPPFRDAIVPDPNWHVP